MIRSNKKYNYAFDSTEGDPGAVDAMIKSSKRIQWRHFRTYCDALEWSKKQGYTDATKTMSLRLCNDQMVYFYVSKYKGAKCFFLERSGVRYIWLKDTDENI